MPTMGAKSPNTMPRSSRNARAWLITAVRLETAHPVNRLEVQLVICLDRNEAHVLATDRFGNSLGIDEVVLIRPHKWLHDHKPVSSA